MCTHNQCSEQKQEKYDIFSSENYHFYSREILLYIARACLRNVYLKSSILNYLKKQVLSFERRKLRKEQATVTALYIIMALFDIFSFLYKKVLYI